MNYSSIENQMILPSARLGPLVQVEAPSSSLSTELAKPLATLEIVFPPTTMVVYSLEVLFFKTLAQLWPELQMYFTFSFK